MGKRFFILGWLAFLLFMGSFVFSHSTFAATRTWDGGGSDGTCGGVAGDGNKWSCAANWSSDTAPVTGDTVTFDSTSTKNATIDSTISLATVNMSTGYTGTITQSAALTITTSFLHSTTDGTFTWSSGTLTFSGATAASWDVDTDDTFGTVTINKTSGANLTVTSGDTVIVTGTLTLTDGNIVTGTIEARGDITHGSTFDGGSGTLSITQGSNAINLTASGQLPIVTLSANRTINGPGSGTTTFDGLFTMTNGTYTGGDGALTLTGGLTISGGSFTGAAGNIDNNGAFSLSSTGSFTAGTGTFFNAGAFTHLDSSTFTASTGTFSFDGGTVTINVNTTETFNNLTFGGTAGTVKTITSGDTLVVAGTLTLTDSNINAGTVEVRGAIAHGAAFDGGTATINITQGSADINLTAGGQLPAVTLNASRNINGAASGTVTFDGLFTVTAGAFVGGAGNVTLTSGLTLNGGNFTAPTATTTIPGAVTISSGTFNESTGTVTVTSTSATWDVATTETLYNLTVSKTNAASMTISAGDTLVVTNTLTLTDGEANTGVIDTRGNITQASTFDGGSAVIDFGDDAVVQTYTLNGGTSPYIEFDDPDDVNDSLTFAAATTIGRLGVTADFTGTVPISNSGDHILTFDIINQQAGTVDASAQTEWRSRSLTIGGGTFLAPELVTINGTSGTWDINVTQDFNDLTVAKNNLITQTFTTGDVFIVLGTTIYQDGRLANTATPRSYGDVTYMNTWDGGAPVSQIALMGSADQTLDLTGATGVHNGSLLIDKSGGQVNLASDLVLDADAKTFIIREGGFNLNGYNLTVTGSNSAMTVEDGGILKLQGGETVTTNSAYPAFDSGSTVTYTGDGDGLADTYTITTVKSTYHHLTINSTDGATDTFELGTSLDVNGDLTNTAGTLDVVSGQNYAITLAGNWTNSGSFQARSGTVTLDGADQTIAGTNTFYALTKAATATAALTFPASVTQTFLGTLTLTGMSISERLSLESNTPGTKAVIDPRGSVTLEYLDVQDSDNDNVTAVTCVTGCIDGGNNENWTFVSATTGGTDYHAPVINTVTVTRPNTIGLRYKAGQKVPINWTATGTGIASVSIFLSVDDGTSYNLIAAGELNDGSYTWLVPEASTTKARILVKATDGTLFVDSDASDKPFTIIPTPPVVLVPLPILPPPPVVVVPEPVVPVPVAEVPIVEPPVEVPIAVDDPLVIGPSWQPLAGTYVTPDNGDGVYYVEQNETFGLVLRPFLNAQTFFTYQSDFDSVHVVSREELSALPTDGVMMPKPGVVLVKLIADDRVYALEASGDRTVIRWITTEELAIHMYGTDWAGYVLDIDPAVWGLFLEGEPILEPAIVDMSIMKKRSELSMTFAH